MTRGMRLPATIQPDGAVSAELLPPAGMVALAWTVNVDPATLEAIAELIARVRSLSKRVDKLAGRVHETLAEMDGQLAGQDIPDELHQLVYAMTGQEGLHKLIYRIADVLLDSIESI
jgi:hypothetical protein